MSYIYIAERNAVKRAYSDMETAKRLEENLIGEPVEWHNMFGTLFAITEKERIIKSKIEEVEIII